jgi:ABC-type antimicrobial peptide transport system, ATPase component
MRNIVHAEHIEKYYGNKGNVTKAIDGISFDIYEGEFVGIMGPSGSGKSTLLNCVSTIDVVTGGHIYIDQQDITTLKKSKLSEYRRSQLGFIFQDFNLLDTLTGFENIALALTINQEKVGDIANRVKNVAKVLDIEDVLDKYPYQMSGGQQQRVACARALITNPQLILADEPTGALDSKSSRILLETLEKMNQDMKATIMMVTHDTFCASYCMRILFIKDGKIFNELIRGNDSRKQFFDRIMDVVALLGGDMSDVI